LFTALPAIIALGSLVFLMTPFAAVGLLLYQLVLLIDIPALRVWNGKITTLIVLGSLQWFLIGLLVAIVARWIGQSIKRST